MGLTFLRVEALELGSVVFECKVGAFVAYEVEGVLNVAGK